MMRRDVFPCLGAMLTVLTLLSGCASARRAEEPTKSSESEVSAVSEVEPRTEEFRERAVPLKRQPPVASSGGCEPRYKNGNTGTCINEQPCRGFGVREDDGKAVCTCFGKRGGCDEGYRCDARGAQCVQEDEAEFNRAR